MHADQRDRFFTFLRTKIPFIKGLDGAVDTEFFEYAAQTESDGNITATINIIKYWLEQRPRFPLLFEALKHILLFHVNSSMVERIFSLVNNFVSDQQTRMSDDMMRLQVMLQFNDSESMLETDSDAAQYSNTWDAISRYVASHLAVQHLHSVSRMPPRPEQPTIQAAFASASRE